MYVGRYLHVGSEECETLIPGPGLAHLFICSQLNFDGVTGV